MYPSILIGNRTGGQGKTLVSQLVHYAFDLCAGVSMRLVSADSIEDGGEGASKLGRFVDGVEELGIGARMGEVRLKPQLAVGHWDRLGQILKSGGCIVDLGANVAPVVFEWAKERNAGRILAAGAEIVLVVPVTAQRQALLDAKECLEMSFEAGSQLPVSRRFVVLNEYHGDFAGVAGSDEFRYLDALAKDGKVSIVRLGKCTSEVWAQVEATFTAVADLVELDHVEYARRFGMNEFQASGAQQEFVEWLKRQIEAFSEAGLVPDVERAPA